MTEIFKKISDINLEEKDSWKGKIFLTLDTDWACDEVLNYVIDIIEEYQNLKVTWFLTNKTKVLERLLKNEDFELGIHPNFNRLLEEIYLLSNLRMK